MLQMGITMFATLMLGFPFMVIILGSIMVYIYGFMPNFNMNVLVQQVLTGIIPPALVCVTMFILAANIITSG
jgi:hypothetical protein